jgi:hypothetical protein
VGGGGFFPVLPDRVDLPFVTVNEPPGQPISDQRVALLEYPDRRWSAEWRAWYGLSEYAATNWQGITVKPWDDTKTKGEIDNLVIAARDERADALGEIVAQNDEFASYFVALLTLRPDGYPATNLLIALASIVGTFTVLHFKKGMPPAAAVPAIPASMGVAAAPAVPAVIGYKPRPRPSQVCPALSPPVPVPGHPSYPSGHSTEAHLIEYVLNDVLSKSVQTVPMAAHLAALAKRIARNREIAGLHYPCDSAAGEQLAKDILPLLQNTDLYTATIGSAQGEWT